MLMRRVVLCLDVNAGRVVKGVSFQDLRDVGDPAALAARYEAAGADEIVFLDVSATLEHRATTLDVARQTAERLFIPLTVGGGVRGVDDVGRALRAGADKVGINSAAIARPDLLREAADRFGRQCVVACIDARRTGAAWRVHSHGGKQATPLDAVEWAARCAELGAGEIVLTSIDRDGTRSGYDLDLTAAIADAVSIPVVASGGAGNAKHVSEVLSATGADAALVAGMVHDGTVAIADIKRQLRAEGIPVRWSES